MKTTLSVIKADVGGFTGHSDVHPRLIESAQKSLDAAKKKGIILDFYVTKVGDDLQLIMTHDKGVDNKDVHALAWDTFVAATAIAKELKLYGAGQDMLADAFSGNIKGMGPGCAELEFEERKSEPVIVFMMDKTDPGALNLPIFKMFGDPFNTAGLIIDPNMTAGFVFEVWDIYENKRIMLNSPEELYELLALIGTKSKYVIKRVYPRAGNKVPETEAAAVISTDKLHLIAGEYVGKDDPVAIVRCQSGLPAQGEVVEPFAFPHLVAGWMRGSHNGPIMPVGMKDSMTSRFDGPTRVMGLGFQIANGKLVGPADLLGDISFDNARRKSLQIADYMRRHGPFEPHRLSAEEMEYTSMPKVMEKLKSRFEKIGK
ncbi:Fructose-1,6-bisphosphate aldolase/phosphatase [uncultured archaeon]|nr:Fructose-1,6-bisphosphate aldolase/phosphatase [uncultured archaeon]